MGCGRFSDLETADGRPPGTCSRVVRHHFDSSIGRDVDGTHHVDREVLAVRGDRLVLVETRVRESASGANAKPAGYTVYEIDEKEQISDAVVFGADDVIAAFDTLDDRFALGEGHASSDVVHSYARIMRACNTQAWRHLRSELVDDFVLLDHRPISLGQIGPDDWVRSLEVATDLSPGRRGDSKAYHAWDRSVVVIEFRFSAGSDYGADYEQRHHGVIQGRDRRISRVEFYTLERLKEALERFEQLRAGSPAR